MVTNPSIRLVVEESIRFLESTLQWVTAHGEHTRQKWDGAWWHMSVLYEMGEVSQIPESVIVKAKHLLETQVWQTFVISVDDQPTTESDKMKMDCCHCELAVFYKILMAYGCDLDRELPWIREWLLKHQLPDGGLNCEPEAYTGSRKSSIVSTLPPLEAILWHTDREYTEQEAAFLDEGARYLMEHRLVFSKQTGNVIDTEWLKPCFPRFFEYDILRGMSYLAEWSRRRNRVLPVGLLLEGLERLNSSMTAKGLRIGRQVFDPQGPWSGQTFPLLETVSGLGDVSPYLTRQLDRILERLGPQHAYL
ncbi:hypothetical protein J14TS5_47570 [Paenibacillus lautus]|uniref:hypothetical protein n=1 Tax=Paenibacillus lautus TaxID=1401 RepID=UPI001AFF76A2|nr:hypothetical protein [Paenibacillus lautus]GIO99671.1 hypothetical protein J14TS5_47570 [Paenibacillus lautus]